MLGKLANKVSLITGGNRGIGRILAIAFAREGSDVVISYREHREEAENVVREIQKLGRKAIAVKADITIEKDRNHLVACAKEAFGVINVLVNNAGIYSQSNYLTVTEEEFDKMMATNVKGAFFLTQAVCRLMIEKIIKGRIINISSFRDTVVTPELLPYQISKAGLLMFSTGLARLMAEHGILCNTISPGTLETPINENIRTEKPNEWEARKRTIPLGIIPDPRVLSGLAVWLASDENTYCTGARIPVDGGRSLMNSFVPARLAKL